MKKNTVIIILALLAIIASVVSIVRNTRDKDKDTEKLILRPYQIGSQRAADETAALLGGKGSIVIIGPSTGGPVYDAVWGEFRQALAKHPGLAITAEVHWNYRDGLDSGLILTTLLEHPDASAVVSIQGFPYFSDAELAQLPQSMPKMIALLGAVEGLRQMFDRPVDGFAIGMSAPAIPGEKFGSPQEYFASHFQILRPPTAARP